ncbi:MAG: hypothetical protein AAGJ83_05735, partial [Planctomycetota bacterium]
MQTDFRVFPGEVSGSQLEIDLPDESRQVGSASIDVGTEPISITIEGVNDWNVAENECLLPIVRLSSPKAIYTEPATQVLVAVWGSLGVAKWELPPGWQQSVQTPSREGERLLVAEGPPSAPPFSDDAWSKLRLYPTADYRVEDIWTALRIQSSPVLQLKAVTQVRCQFLQSLGSPIRFEVNGDWTVDGVTMRSSGRQLSPPVNGELLVWPTQSELASGPLELEVVAHRNLSGSPRSIAVPRTWVLRDRQQTSPQTVAIHPPKLRRWDGSSALISNRLDEAMLSRKAADFLAPESGTLLLSTPNGIIPEVTLQAIDVSFAVDITHQVQERDGQIIESIRIDPQASQPLAELTVLTGSPQSSVYEWSLVRTDTSATLSIPRSSILIDESDPSGAMTIRLDDRDLNDYVLLGQRSIEADDEIKLGLPSVRLARNKTALLTLDSSLEIESLPAGIQRVPTPLSDADASETRQTLRYDPLLRPEITLRRRNRDSMPCLVWRQSKVMSVSSRCEDQVTFSFKVSALRPIELVFDEELELLSCSRNGVASEPISVEMGRLVVQPQDRTDNFVLKMRRRHTSDGFLRKCDVPKISVVGEVMDESFSINTTPETLVLWRAGAAIQADGRALWLVPREFAVAFGFLGFGVVFLMSWCAARWTTFGLQILLSLFILLSCASVIWWEWQVPVLLWATLPVGLAALVHVLVRGPRSDDRVASGRDDDGERRTGDHSKRAELSLDFSVSGKLVLFLAMLPAVPGQGQSVVDPSPKSTRVADEDAIELLVPISREHQIIGSKVYLAESDYQQILESADPNRPVDVSFRSAVYRVNCRTSRESGDEIIAEIYGEYGFVFDREVTRLRLPFRPETIRRIELLGENASQIIQFSVDSEGAVTAVVPPSDQMRLRVTFLPDTISLDANGEPSGRDPVAALGDVSAEGRSGREVITDVRFSIPSVHAAKLFVEASPPLVIDSLGPGRGRTILEQGLGRYESDLGNATEVRIRCRLPQADQVTTEDSIRRSYRIAAGVSSTVIECEVLPGAALKVGESTQLTILGQQPDAMTSSGWQMRLLDSGESIDRTGAAT